MHMKNGTKRNRYQLEYFHIDTKHIAFSYVVVQHVLVSMEGILFQIPYYPIVTSSQK